MNEVWKDIPSCEGYEASNTGKIRRKAYELKPSDMNGYKIVNPGGRNSKMPIAVHRLIMEAFNGPSDLVVNHKDGVRFNNNLCNLEYTTQKENIRHARAVLGKEFGYKKGECNGKQRIGIEAFKDGISVGIFKSQQEASFELRVPQGNISSQMNGKLKITDGYTFKKVI